MRDSVMLMRKADTSRKIGGITRRRASSWRQLGVEEGVRELVLAGVGADAAVARSSASSWLEHLGLGGARQQPQS